MIESKEEFYSLGSVSISLGVIGTHVPGLYSHLNWVERTGISAAKHLGNSACVGMPTRDEAPLVLGATCSMRYISIYLVVAPPLLPLVSNLNPYQL